MDIKTPDYRFSLDLSTEFRQYESLSFFEKNASNREQLQRNVQTRVNNRLLDIKMHTDRAETEIKRLKAEVALLQGQLSQLKTGKTPKAVNELKGATPLPPGLNIAVPEYAQTVLEYREKSKTKGPRSKTKK